MRGRDIALIVGLVIVVVLLFGLFGSGMMGFGMMGPYGGWMGPGMMGGFGFGWGILMLVFWALVIGGIVILVVRLLGPGQVTTAGGPGSHDRALDILRERYAKGEITREQYEQMRCDLE